LRLLNKKCKFGGTIADYLFLFLQKLT